MSIHSAMQGSSAEPELLISVRGASRKFCREQALSLRYAAFDALRQLLARPLPDTALRPGEFWALRNISFEVRRGQAVGVMGLNGAGKSTLLKLMRGSLRLTEGQIVTSGRLATLCEHGLGFDPLLSGRENVYMTAAVLEIDRRRVDQAFDQIVAFAGLEQFIDSPVRIYSTGMRARLGFSVAMYLQPDILLVDEVLAVGDLGFQRRCVQYAKRYLEGGGSLVLVSHNPNLVQFICDRCLIIDHGVIVFDGSVVEGVGEYLKATRTASHDPLARDAALAEAPPRFRPPSENSGVEIVAFDLQPIHSAALRTGQAARVSLRYRASRDLNVRWGFCLLTADLRTTITCEGLLEPFSISEGAGELTGTIPRLPLAGGRYAMRVAIMDPDTELPLALGGYQTEPWYFLVEAPTTIRNNYRIISHDLVALEDIRWDRSGVHAGEQLQPSESTAGY